MNLWAQLIGYGPLILGLHMIFLFLFLSGSARSGTAEREGGISGGLSLGMEQGFALVAYYPSKSRHRDGVFRGQKSPAEYA